MYPRTNRTRDDVLALVFSLILVSTLASAPAIASPASAAVVPPRLLVIGDSQSTGVFGAELDARLREKVGDANVDYYASCGSSPVTWFEGRSTRCGYVERHPGKSTVTRRESATPRIDGLLARHAPDAVIVQMGGNLIGKGVDAAGREADKLAALLATNQLPCVWVGPPHGTRRPQPLTDQVIARLKQVLPPRCSFIDSYPITQYPPGVGDGIHYDQAGEEGRKRGRQWARDALAGFPSDFLAPKARTTAPASTPASSSTLMASPAQPGIKSEPTLEKRTIPPAIAPPITEEIQGVPSHHDRRAE